MTGQRRILVVDDDRVTRELLKTVLEHADYEVILAEDGVSGVEKAASEAPDLVMIDGLMPRLHGFLACKAIKELKHPPKVILLSGIYTKPNYKWEAKHEYNADDFLTKPIRPVELLACVEKHLAGLPQLDRAKPLHPATVNENSSVVSRFLTSNVNTAPDTRPAGYSANWKPTSSNGRLLPRT